MVPKTLNMTALGLLALVLGVGPTRDALAEKPLEDAPALVPGSSAVRLPAAMTTRLGIQTAEVEPRVAGKSRVLQLTGSTALDPAKVYRIRGHFAPFEVIEVAKPEGKKDRSLRHGDFVSKGQVLATLHSPTVASKKSSLFDATVQLKLDQEIYDRAVEARGQAPEVFILNAKRNVAAGQSAVNRVRTTLKSWGISDTDIEAVSKEAGKVAENAKPETEEARKARLKEWSNVVLKAPADGVLVETNISAGENVTDSTVNLFTIANVDRLLIVVNVAEDDLPYLSALKPGERRWSVKSGGATVVGTFDDIGSLVDPNTHTAIVKGPIDNKDHTWRAGQFVTASITLPLSADEVSVSAASVVEEKGQTFVFVQPDAKKPVYEQRRVVVVRRGTDTVHIRTKLTAEETRQGLQTLRPGERVVTAGALELRGILTDLKGE